MADRDIERLMNELRSSLPGAVDATIQLALFSVMDDFFKGTNAWQEDIDIDVPANDPAGATYYAIPSTPSIIDKLLWAFEKPTQPNTLRGAPVAAYMSVPGEITLRTQPSTPATYRVTVALTVADPLQKDGNVIFPKWIIQKYRGVLFDGVLGRMMSQPNKPFTNTQLSVYHLRRFRNYTAAARIEVQRNNRYAAQAWRFPSFASGSQKGGSGWANPQ